jgi:hypothetical protein
MFGIQIKNGDGEYRWVTSWSEHDGAKSKIMSFPTVGDAEIQAQVLELKNYRVERVAPSVDG